MKNYHHQNKYLTRVFFCTLVSINKWIFLREDYFQDDYLALSKCSIKVINYQHLLIVCMDMHIVNITPNS